jgi:ubiquinol-cytochrome c reductase cytochrome b subunit
MSDLRDKVVSWLDHRTGVETAIRNFLYEEIPDSSGWRHVFGSVAVFLFLTQAFTGALLAFNYAPTPGEAYNSLRYILTELTGGRLIRGLHHWGASMMIVVVVLHMVQVFLWGAYKKPREATWIVGVVLFLLTLAYGLTGYLLPWDNRAYWGTVVTTQIAGSAPLLGPYMSRLLGGESAVGVVTFARFYGMHVLLLPPATTLLIALHVYLVRKHGVAPTPEDETRPRRKFYPEQVYRDTVAIFVAFAVLFTLAVAARVPLERLADPTDTSYIPRPEWYFLFLFQTLKFLKGPLETIGAVGLPALAVLALVLVPFVDRGRLQRVTRRTAAMGAVALVLVGWTGLTVAAVATTPKPDISDQIDFSGPTDWLQLSPEELAGLGFVQKEHCESCHTVGSGKPKVGPDLATTRRKTAAWMIDHFKRPSAMVPGSQMPPIQLSTPQLNSLASFLLKLNQNNAESLFATPQFAVNGALVYQGKMCGACHMANGVGMKIGPPLNGLDKRRTREWIVKHFNDPQGTSPGTIMPPYKLPPAEMDDLVSYLLSLPD